MLSVHHLLILIKIFSLLSSLIDKLFKQIRSLASLIILYQSMRQAIPTQSIEKYQRKAGTCSFKVRSRVSLGMTKNYSDLISRHLIGSNIENNYLLNATKNYKSQLKILRNQSVQTLQKHRNSKRIYPYQSEPNNNPQKYQMIDIFVCKTEKIVSSAQEFKNAISEKVCLLEQIAKLKKNIKNEKKKNQNVLINNGQLLNQQETLKFQIRKRKEESLQVRMNIQEEAARCSHFNNQIQQILLQNRSALNKIQLQESKIDELGKIIHQLKKKLEKASLQLGNLKVQCPIAYKAMINDYGSMNKRKQQKAYILSCIDMQSLKFD